MAQEIVLVAPNGRSFKLNTGLFIDNNFVAAAEGAEIVSIDPASVNKSPNDVSKVLILALVPANRSPQSKLLEQEMWTSQSEQPGVHLKAANGKP